MGRWLWLKTDLRPKNEKSPEGPQGKYASDRNVGITDDCLSSVSRAPW